MSLHTVADIHDVPADRPLIVQVRGISIGIFNVQGQFFAIRNYCPHQGAELCRNTTCGTTLPSQVYEFQYGRNGEVIRCPWHGWEFDIKTGRSLFDERIRTKSYAVHVQDGKIAIDMSGQSQ